jgi:hypothetical protein
MADGMGENKDDMMEATLSDDAAAFEENIILKKYTSMGSATVSGDAPVIGYTDVKTTAVVDDIGLEMLKAADGVFAAGDLVFQIRGQRPHEPTQNPIHPGDRIVYESVEYRIVQKPQLIYLGGVIHWECICRRLSE